MNPKADGMMAYNDNRTLDENPHDRGTERIAYWAWREGWLLAHSADNN